MVRTKRKSDDRPCPTPELHHEPGCPDGYLDRQDWFEKMARTHEQRRCPGCGLWRIWVSKRAHDWEELSMLPGEGRFAGMSRYGLRRCRRCKVVQEKHSHHEWMRVVGYRWEPLAGRCKGRRGKPRR